MRITVARALNELKLIHKKIVKAISGAEFISLEIDGKTNQATPEASYQKIIDLIDRRNRLKAGILKSNAVTEVKVGPNTMTVVEAIDQKEAIVLKNKLLNRMKESRYEVQHERESLEFKSQQRLDKLIQSLVGDNAGPEISSQITETTTAFKQYFPVLLDPLDLSTKITDLDDEIDTFISEVDLVLSESNAVTTFEIED